MPVPSSLNDLSTTPALNSPAGSESPSTLDDYIRTHASFIKQVSDSKDTLDAANVKLTGNQTIAGTKTFSSAPVVPGLNGGQLAGIRNKIINGNFGINQRGVSGTVTLAAGAYGHDRWKAGASGCTYTFATVQNVTTITITSGSLSQVIEGNNLQSGTHVLSWTGTAQGRVDSGSYGASGAVTGTAVGGTNQTIEFNTGTVSKVQYEPGTVATPFEHRPYGSEETLCKRYTRVIASSAVFGGRANGTAVVRATIHGGIPMRATPTASDVAANAFGPTQVSTKSGGAVSVVANTDAGVVVDVSGFSGLTDNRVTTLELLGALTLSAEL